MVVAEVSFLLNAYARSLEYLGSYLSTVLACRESIGGGEERGGCEEVFRLSSSSFVEEGRHIHE